MKKFKRVFVIVMDSVGCGEARDAADFGDTGANTLGHIASWCHGINIPTLEKLGYGLTTYMYGVDNKIKPQAYVTKLQEVSNGKDTMTGHWEMMGLKTTEPFVTFTETGFPKELIEKLEKESGRKVIGNYAESGTEILKQLGEEQTRDGSIIVYTSSDSVLQIAANEATIPLEELYDICHKARKITLDNPKWKVGRIIARPYVGTKADNFKRTPNRHDYTVNPFAKTTLNYLQEAGKKVISVGKIYDIFNGYGIDESNPIVSNHDGMLKTTSILENDNFEGLCFVNLVDFDAVYGHRRNPEGYKKAIEEFDTDLQNFINKMHDDDLVIITADHGNDPTFTGTDHTRELVPIISYHKNIKGSYEGVKEGFSCIGKTVAENFDVTLPKFGSSFLNKL